VVEEEEVEQMVLVQQVDQEEGEEIILVLVQVEQEILRQ
jgi:hypothetical protein